MYWIERISRQQRLEWLGLWSSYNLGILSKEEMSNSDKKSFQMCTKKLTSNAFSTIFSKKFQLKMPSTFRGFCKKFDEILVNSLHLLLLKYFSSFNQLKNYFFCLQVVRLQFTTFSIYKPVSQLTKIQKIDNVTIIYWNYFFLNYKQFSLNIFLFFNVFY